MFYTEDHSDSEEYHPSEVSDSESDTDTNVYDDEHYPTPPLSQPPVVNENSTINKVNSILHAMDYVGMDVDVQT
jgi:hypothetical protein